MGPDPKPDDPPVHEETDSATYADDRMFYKVEKKWTRDRTKVDSLLYAGNSLGRARSVFGVRPGRWAVSCGGFDRLPGVMILELRPKPSKMSPPIFHALSMRSTTPAELRLPKPVIHQIARPRP